MDQKEYIQKLERKIRMQRAQLRWWQQMFEIKALRPKTFCWSASEVSALLRRHKSPEVALKNGGTVRRVKINREASL